MNRSSFVDTDILLKIGGFHGEELLKKILLSFGYDLYIHEYLLQEELIIGGKASEQLNEMIGSEEISIMYESDLDDQELQEYRSALGVLASEMEVDLQKKRDKNAGEVKSMAMAFAKDFEYFISDDRTARVVAKRSLQKLDGSYLETIRMKDVIMHIRKNNQTLEIDRKTARRLNNSLQYAFCMLFFCEKEGRFMPGVPRIIHLQRITACWMDKSPYQLQQRNY